MPQQSTETQADTNTVTPSENVEPAAVDETRGSFNVEAGDRQREGSDGGGLRRSARSFCGSFLVVLHHSALVSAIRIWCRHTAPLALIRTTRYPPYGTNDSTSIEQDVCKYRGSFGLQLQLHNSFCHFVDDVP